jgi:putative MFS transporter
MGIAVGADYPIATSLLTEFAPKKQRGMVLGLLTCLWYVGAVVAGFVGFALLQLGPEGWRWMLGSSAIPALLLLIGRWEAPESARWLLNKGRKQEALAVVKRVWGSEAELADLEQDDSESVKTNIKALFKPGYGKRLFFVCMFWVFQLIPLFAIYTFGPMILGAFGFGDGNLWVIGYLFIDLMFLLGSIPPLWLISIWGRRPTLIAGYTFMTLGMLALGIFPDAPVGFVIAAFCVYAFCSGGPAILQWIYSNELFPTEVRASAIGIGTAVSRIGAALGTFALPLALTSIGLGPTLLVSAFVCFLGLLVSVWLAPETKGMTLREASSVNFTDLKKR